MFGQISFCATNPICIEAKAFGSFNRVIVVRAINQRRQAQVGISARAVDGFIPSPFASVGIKAVIVNCKWTNIRFDFGGLEWADRFGWLGAPGSVTFSTSGQLSRVID